MKQTSVLLIDDDPATHRFLQRLLRSYSVHVEAVTDFATALQRLRDHEFAVIISEQRLSGDPQPTLFDVLDEIRQLRPDVPLILLTASSQPELMKTAYRSGISFYFHKPVNRDVFLDALKSVGLLS